MIDLKGFAIGCPSSTGKPSIIHSRSLSLNNTLQATSLKTLGIKLNIKLIFSTALLKYSSVYNTVGPKPEQIGTKPNPNIEGIKKKWVLIIH